MANINQKNAPGVYTQIIDKSLSSTTTARFRPGLIGVASKGPFDTPTTIATVQDFIANFGQPIPGYSFLATAVGVLAPYTNGSVVVRVGGQYQDLPVVGFTGTASGTQGANYFVTNVPQLLNPANTATGNLFVSLSEPGQLNTVNAMVASWNSSGTIELGSVAYASTYNTPGQTDYIADPEAVSPVLNASYTNATIQTSAWPNAASDAQALLLGYTYTDITEYAGLVSGSKNDFYFTVTQDPTVNPYLVPGNLVRISSYEGTRYVTEEALVSGVTPLVNNGNAVILLQATDDTARGYQAVPLQDNYANAKLEVVSGMTPAFLLSALTAGSWANTTVGNPTTGLQVKVGPGTQPGTKKLSIYSDGALVEVYDNLGYPPTNTFTDTPVKLAGILDYEATINTNAPSQNITITAFGYGTNAANTLAPWQSSPAVPIINGYSPLHTDALTGGPANVVNDAATDQIKGGYFADGFSGENAQASDFVGGYQPVTDTMTGLKAFEDTNNITITALCAPGITDAASGVSLPVHTQLRDTAIATKSIALIDVPPFFTDESVTLNPLTTGTLPLTGWNAIDWCNGQGPFISRGLLNTPYLAAFWNWFTMQDPITQQTILAPPTIGVLERMASTWLTDQPWYAAAGDNRGVIAEATGVQFPTISSDLMEAMFAPGNCVNPIISRNGVIMVYGEQTMLRIPQGDTDKLTSVHNLVLVEYVLQGLSQIGRRYVFEPNDATLLGQINLEMTGFLESLVALRGIESYNLVCNTSNNTAVTRNLKQVIVDLYLIPVDAVDQIYINATVESSGANLNQITS
jgi:hypothetical protein